VTLPGLTALTLPRVCPFESAGVTVATAGSLVVQVTVCSVSTFPPASRVEQ
jgi:hypothetical protein